MTIPFLDLVRLHRSIRPELDEAFDRVLGNASFHGGPELEAFEAAFARAHGHPDGTRAVGVGSGTDALAMALRALGIGPGDEVIVPAMTFVATAEAVAHVGATPVVADVDARTLLLTPAAVARVRTPRTRAVVPVHLYGHPVDFADLSEWRDQGLSVIEDAAQAHLASWRGEPVGTVGHAACFSFYAGKNLGALGDGGLVLLADADAADRARRLRDHGRTTKYVHDEVGWCTRLDGLQAALLLVKLRHLPAWTAARRRVAGRYRDRIGPLLVPWEDDGAVHHLLVARTDRRDDLAAALAAAGIGTGLHYPVDLAAQPWLRAWGAAPGGAPAAARAASEVLSLPMDPLMDDDEVDAVCAAVESAVRQPAPA
jgi:dTDP-4-amino-4,6-dideoxygalactose transaminase